MLVRDVKPNSRSTNLTFILKQNRSRHARSIPDRSTTLTLSGITKTYLYNFDPLKPHFYIVKLGFTGVYIIFLISDQNIDCEYSLELLTSTHNLCFEQKHEYQNFFSEKFHFLVMKFSVCLNRHVFVMRNPIAVVFAFLLRRALL